jgi:uncharacterized protein (TIGR02145 family)
VSTTIKIVTMKNTRIIGTYRKLMFGLVLLVACNGSNNETDLGNIETDTFTDPRDGKIYRTVKIGDQWIMAENLAYKPDKGNFWAYDNNDSNIAIYGYLYDWKTAMNIAPEGWHLPSKGEWDALQKSLGAKHTTYPYLEKMYPKLVVGGTSGLNMLLGGIRTCDGEFKYLGDRARFWTSTTTPPFQWRDSMYTEKTIYGLDSNKDGAPHGLRLSKAPYVYNNSQYRRSCEGFSVRLFKD